MVPAYLEQLPALPVLPSGKADRKNLPAPSAERRLATRGDYVTPAEGAERDLAELLASALRVERVSADSHFFDDLGADSLLMARFNAAIRGRGDLPAVSMKDIYLHPTIRRLAAAIGGAGSATAFKSDHITIGTGCTLGTGAFVHYGATMGDDAILDTDSFLMKGEHVPPHARWRGNPAADVPDHDGRRPPAHRRGRGGIGRR